MHIFSKYAIACSHITGIPILFLLLFRRLT